MSDNQDNAGIITHPPVFYIMALLIGLGLDYLYPISFGFMEVTRTASIFIFISSGIILALGFGMFATNKQSPSVHASAAKVYKSGIYAYSRNPLYLSLVLLMLALSLFFDKVWIAIMILPVIIIVNKFVIEKEETYMEDKFGDDYLDYKKKVRRWI